VDLVRARSTWFAYGVTLLAVTPSPLGARTLGDVPQHDMGIRNRCFDSAATVRRWAGIGTRALRACAGAKMILVASFLNLRATTNWLLERKPQHLILVCSYAFNMATLGERFEGHITPLLINILGMKRFAKVVVSQGMKQLSKERADWVIDLIANQNDKLMMSAWKETMAFDSRRRLSEIRCPTLVIAASNDERTGRQRQAQKRRSAGPQVLK
jgi:pimeloyl-ACP methyl ester carboxylesterase